MIKQIKSFIWFLGILLFLQGCQQTTPVAGILEEFHKPHSEVVLVAAHRSAHNIYPENSVPAINEAIRLGVDIIELDVKVTKDGVPVLMHDGTIDRTTTGTGKPSEYTFKEIQQFSLIHKGDTTDQKIPTFEQAMSLAKGNVMVDIDLKTDVLDPIIEVLKSTGTEDIAFFFDNDYDALTYVKEKNPEFMLMPRSYDFHMTDSALVRFQPEVIHIDFDHYSADNVKHIKDEGARVWINALGMPDRMAAEGKVDEAYSKVIEYGANVVQTDQPEMLLGFLRERGLHR